MNNDQPTAYPTSLRAMHWLMAAVVITAWFIGDWAADQPREARAEAIGLHIAVASSVLVLVLLRLALRATRPVPDALPTTGALMQSLARFTHGLLYVLMLALPITGWLTINSGGRPFVLMKLVEMPALMGKDPAWHERFEDVHVTLAWTLAVLVLLHIAAALKHQFIDRDSTLARMLPMLKQR